MLSPRSVLMRTQNLGGMSMVQLTLLENHCQRKLRTGLREPFAAHLPCPKPQADVWLGCSFSRIFHQSHQEVGEGTKW